MSSYWVERIKQKVKDTTILGSNFKGIPVIPSDKEYYSNYMYKVEIKGNSVSYDIELHNEIDKWMQDNWYYGTRSQWTTKNRLIFFSKIDKLENFLSLFSNSVQGLYGPISKDHLEQMLLPDIKIKKVFKDKLWYNKYDIKLEMSISGSYNREKIPELKQRSYDFRDFVNNTVSDCHWYASHMAGWRNNYVYMTETQYKVLQPWIKLAYDDMVLNVYQVCTPK